MNELVVDVQGLSRRFGDNVALDDVSLQVREGSVLGLVGENGAGKTTLIKHLLGLYQAQAGAVAVFGLDPVRAPEKVLARIGCFGEDKPLPPWMRVGDLIAHWRSFYPTWDDAYVHELLELFELPQRQQLRTLSRGQRARVGLLLAVAHRPALLVLDEPSGGLDPVVRNDILSQVIRGVVDDGRTVLFSSHLLDEVQRISDHLALIHKGRIRLAGPLDTVLAGHERYELRLPADRTSLQSHVHSRDTAVHCTGSGRNWTLVASDSGAAHAIAQANDAEVVERSAATLDEVFVAYVNVREQAEV